MNLVKHEGSTVRDGKNTRPRKDLEHYSLEKTSHYKTKLLKKKILVVGFKETRVHAQFCLIFICYIFFKIFISFSLFFFLVFFFLSSQPTFFPCEIFLFFFPLFISNDKKKKKTVHISLNLTMFPYFKISRLRINMTILWFKVL